MEINPIAKEITAILETLKKDYKLTQAQISVGIKHPKNYVSEQKSKKPNKKLLQQLKDYHMELVEAAKNPAPEILTIVKELKNDIKAMRENMEVMRTDVAELKAQLSAKQPGRKR
jgi:uncharacterized short protein YbdD (DUF466 family)